MQSEYKLNVSKPNVCNLDYDWIGLDACNVKCLYTKSCFKVTNKSDSNAYTIIVYKYYVFSVYKQFNAYHEQAKAIIYK